MVNENFCSDKNLGPFLGPKICHFRSKISFFLTETTHKICLKLGQKLETLYGFAIFSFIPLFKKNYVVVFFAFGIARCRETTLHACYCFSRTLHFLREFFYDFSIFLENDFLLFSLFFVCFTTKTLHFHNPFLSNWPLLQLISL